MTDFNQYKKYFYGNGGGGGNEEIQRLRLEIQQEQGDQRQVVREERLKLAKAQEQARLAQEYATLKRQQQQADDVTEATAYMIRLRPGSLHFNQGLLAIRTRFPAAFDPPKVAGDTSVLETLKPLLDEHDSRRRQNEEFAKLYGHPADESNPGYNKETGMIDWEKARFASLQRQGKFADQAGLTPSRVNPDGTIIYTDSQKKLEQQQQNALGRISEQENARKRLQDDQQDATRSSTITTGLMNELKDIDNQMFKIETNIAKASAKRDAAGSQYKKQEDRDKDPEYIGQKSAVDQFNVIKSGLDERRKKVIEKGAEHGLKLGQNQDQGDGSMLASGTGSLPMPDLNFDDQDDEDDAADQDINT